jgi:hypothetical protein
MEESLVQDAYKANESLGYIEGTDWAIPYWAPFLSENDDVNKEVDMYKHVNCNYLSTPGRPPTLAALKKHAQSLTYLISKIAPSQGPGEINNAKSGDPTAKSFIDGEAFDWLNDLESPYKSQEPQHNRPLNALVNTARYNSDTTGVEFHCPLENPLDRKSTRREEEKKLVEKRGQEEADYQDERHVKPFARHWNLLRHANECLEILDHEFSATGGLLSILPSEHGIEAEQLDVAKNTLIGQWLLFTQQLVARMHDLEIAYANSLDLLEGEAVIPMQHMTSHGPDGRSGREMVFPQDRWILANAGDDVITFVHRLLDEKQKLAERKDRNRGTEGTLGDVLNARPEDNEGNDSRRGIVSVDLTTRFYRLRGNGNERGPVVILPAYGDRPNTKYTRMMEDRPTVVTLPAPVFPDRVSDYQLGNRKMAEDNRTLFIKSAQLEESVKTLQAENEKLKSEATEARTVTDSMRKAMMPDQIQVSQDIIQLRKNLQQSKDKETATQTQVSAAEAQIQALLPNDYSWDKLQGKLPRDLDGNVTEGAMRSMLQSLKKANDQNTGLLAKVTALQYELRSKIQELEQRT